MPWTGFLVVEVLATLAIAPVAGVLVGIAPRPARAAGAALAILVCLYAGMAFAIVRNAPVAALAGIARAQGVCALAACAMAASGALASTLFREPLDAAATATAGWLIAGIGVIAAGPAAADLPASMLNRAIFASPLCAAASAADIDLFRLPLLYRVSPIAHVRFDYPSWQAAALVYLIVAIGCALVAVVRVNRSVKMNFFEGTWL